MATTSKSSTPKTATTAGAMAMNGVKAVVDVGMLPGGSQLMEGNVKSGVLYAVGGLAARAILGPIGWLAFGADSMSKSLSGKHLHEHFFTVDVDKAND